MSGLVFDLPPFTIPTTLTPDALPWGIAAAVQFFPPHRKTVPKDYRLAFGDRVAFVDSLDFTCLFLDLEAFFRV
jgi:hypothetical protein